MQRQARGVQLPISEREGIDLVNKKFERTIIVLTGRTGDFPMVYYFERAGATGSCLERTLPREKRITRDSLVSTAVGSTIALAILGSQSRPKCQQMQ